MAYTILSVVVPWLLVGVGVWLVFELVKMSGRILLRLEALEGRLSPLLSRPGSPSKQSGSVQHVSDQAGLAPGTAAPEFDLVDLTGARHTLAEYQGRRLLLIFFNPHCGFCTGMADALAELGPSGENGAPMVVLLSAGPTDDNRAMVEEYGLKCPLLLQQQSEVASRYAATGTPMGYLIDEQLHIGSSLLTGPEALLAVARPASAPGHVAWNPEATNGQPARKGTSGVVAIDSAFAAETPAAQGQRCKKCKGKKQPCTRCSQNGTPAPDEVQEYDLFELPTGAGMKEVLEQLNARATRSRRLIVAQHTLDLTNAATALAGIRRFLMNNKNWIVSYREPGDRQFFVLSRDPRDRKPLASTLARAANFARAVAIHIGDGGTHVTTEQLEQRLETCVLCDSRNGEHCSACGCSLLVKARWRTSKCPLNKWPPRQ